MFGFCADAEMAGVGSVAIGAGSSHFLVDSFARTAVRILTARRANGQSSTISCQIARDFLIALSLSMSRMRHSGISFRPFVPRMLMRSKHRIIAARRKSWLVMENLYHLK